jgi:glycosyltransferase involved in cell wall biosynthesis
MRVLQIAPLRERVPPPAYGGTESVVSLLADGLVRAGCEVTLSASGDSLTLADLRSVYPCGLRAADEVQVDTAVEWIHASEAVALADGFDIVHNHAGESVMVLAAFTRTPMLTTTHNPITADNKIVWDRYADYYNTVSEAQFRSMPRLGTAQYAGYVYNAIDVSSFPYCDKKEGYLLSLNRIHPDKGTHLAIEVARRTGRRLVIAGKWDDGEERYFRDAVEPCIDGDRIVFVGEADQRSKRELLAKAFCVLMPILWEEPFGLVMVEAMACGTPVVAFARGAAPEVIVQGETGFLVDDVDEMASAIEDIGTIRSTRCRERAIEFDVPVMVEGYLRLYHEILDRTVTLQKEPIGSGPGFDVRHEIGAGASVSE